MRKITPFMGYTSNSTEIPLADGSGCSFNTRIITDSVVLWKIQKFDLLIPETK